MKGRERSRPYTALYLSALKMGFSTSDIKDMRYADMLWYAHEWAHVNRQDNDEDEVREISGAEANRILMR